jgi:purine nucleoside phosphorylase
MTDGTLPRAEIGSIGGSRTWGMRRFSGIPHPHPPNAALPPWRVVIPDDFIQHWIPPTTARLGSGGSRVREPLCGGLRRHLLAAARRQERFSVVDGGVYVCTPPGRFETAAEIRMLAGWGAHIVGQTLGHAAPPC